MNLFIIIVIAFLFCSSCNHQDKSKLENRQVVDIQVEDGIKNQVDWFQLSDAIKDIEIISLETNENCIFDYVWNITVGKNDLFLNTGGIILRFDRQSGKFLNQIGQIGQGPTDVYYCRGCGLDERTKWIYTLSSPTGENEVKSFTYDGKWQRTIKAARKGAWLEAGSFPGADRTYCYVNGKHIFRRMLPIQDGTKSLWQIGIMDSTGKYLFKVVDPICVEHEKKMTDHTIGKKPINEDIVNYAIFSPSPILNRYYNHINFLFSGNDTIYRYSEKQSVFKPRYILQCGKRPTFEEIHRMGHSENYYRSLFVSSILETKDYLYIEAVQDAYAYLLRVDKKDGSAVSVKNKGEYEDGVLWKIKMRKVKVPGFTNDLCGGPAFYPFDQDDRRWIAVYEAADLLEQIDLEELKAAEVLMPEKKELLIHIIENLKEDDNPVIMIATLK